MRHTIFPRLVAADITKVFKRGVRLFELRATTSLERLQKFSSKLYLDSVSNNNDYCNSLEFFLLLQNLMN